MTNIRVIGRDPAKAAEIAAALGATTGTFGATPAGKVVVDISNTFVGPDDTDLVTPEGTSGAQQIAAALPAFIESLGLRPLDVGGLEMAHWLEGAGLLMMGLARSGAGFDIALGAELLG
ncbi:hypothetical protein ACGFMK_47090 [Amycolatopsis sp. NPDC049252]|uniref:hypothetical protein n=1 Tax=Amycolatopsis sp. NPDC049252 TaxID=3363933 RepID=UPI003715BF57